jgi:hypothetical protein
LATAGVSFPDFLTMPLTITDGALPWQRLAVKNAHPRDARITFREEDHTYAIDGDRTGWTSCTTFIGTFHEHFDADAVIAKMMSGRNWTKSEYYGMTAAEIKAKWEANGVEASTLGTRMHEDIERYNNAEPVGNLAGDDYTPNPSKEWEYFLDYDKNHRQARGFEPYRTEWLVFKEDIKLAGSIDMVYRKPDGTLAIYDWKRAKKMEFDNKWQKMLSPLDHLPDTNYWHYSMQLNIYRRILQELYGEVVSELALVVLHPIFDHYRVIKLNLMDAEVEAMFQVRAERLRSPPPLPAPKPAAKPQATTEPTPTAEPAVEEDEIGSKKPLFVDEDSD